MIVHLKLFAVAKDLAGRSQLELELPEAATVADLRRRVAEVLPELRELLPSVMIAVAAQYAADDTPIPPDAEVALIPPVSGG